MPSLTQKNNKNYFLINNFIYAAEQNETILQVDSVILKSQTIK